MCLSFETSFSSCHRRRCFWQKLHLKQSLWVRSAVRIYPLISNSLTQWRSRAKLEELELGKRDSIRPLVVKACCQDKRGYPAGLTTSPSGDVVACRVLGATSLRAAPPFEVIYATRLGSNSRNGLIHFCGEKWKRELLVKRWRNRYRSHCWSSADFGRWWFFLFIAPWDASFNGSSEEAPLSFSDGVVKSQDLEGLLGLLLVSKENCCFGANLNIKWLYVIKARFEIDSRM